MATLGDLVIKLSMDAAGFKSDAGRAAYTAEQSMGRIVAAGKNAAKAIAGIAAGIGAIGVAAAVKAGRIADAVAEQVDALGEAAEAAQISARAYQTLEVAMGEAGVSAEQFDSGLKKLNQSISEAAEDADSKAGEAFRRLGISVRDAQGNLKNADQVLEELDRRFDTLPDGPDKVAIAIELMGKSGAKFIPALNADLKTLQESAEKTGQVFSEDLTKAAEDYKAALADLRGETQSWSNSIAEVMLPAMAKAARGLKDLMKDIRESAQFIDEISGGPEFDAREAEQRRKREAAELRGLADAFGTEPLKAPAEKGAKKAKAKQARPTMDFQEDLTRLVRMQEADEREAAQARMDAYTEESEERLRLAEKEQERIKELERDTAVFQNKIAEEEREEEEKERKKYLKQIEDDFEDMARQQERITDELSDDLATPLLEFVQGTKTAKEAFTDFVGSITASLQRMAAQNLAEQIFGNLFKGGGGSGAGGFIASLFGSGGGGGAALDAMDIAAFFGGGQHGLRFPANRMIRVGERGPEMLYTGNTTGHVEPMKETKQSNNNININVNVPGQTDRRTADQIAAQVGVSVNRAMRRIN